MPKYGECDYCQKPLTFMNLQKNTCSCAGVYCDIHRNKSSHDCLHKIQIELPEKLKDDKNLKDRI